MGWDGIFIHTPHKTNSEKIACFNSYYKFDFAKAVIKNGVLYGAVKDINKETDEPIVWGLVAIINFYTNKFETEMRCKLMDETMHPYYYNCPKSILDLLTITDNEHSNEWRKRCYEELAKQKEKAKVKKTDYLFIKSGVKFSNGDIQYVFVKNKYGKNRYHSISYSDHYTHYRFNPNDYEVQYITESQYVACEKAYKQKFHAECVVSDYDDNIISFEDAVKLAPKLTKERYDECLELAKQELCDIYQNIINQTE